MAYVGSKWLSHSVQSPGGQLLVNRTLELIESLWSEGARLEGGGHQAHGDWWTRSRRANHRLAVGGQCPPYFTWQLVGGAHPSLGSWWAVPTLRLAVGGRCPPYFAWPLVGSAHPTLLFAGLESGGLPQSMKMLPSDAAACHKPSRLSFMTAAHRSKTLPR